MFQFISHYNMSGCELKKHVLIYILSYLIYAIPVHNALFQMEDLSHVMQWAVFVTQLWSEQGLMLV
jgi:hypothetical protein